jgi:hypothetical protein
MEYFKGIFSYKLTSNKHARRNEITFTTERSDQNRVLFQSIKLKPKQQGLKVPI